MLWPRLSFLMIVIVLYSRVANAQAVDPCVAALAPDIDIVNSSDQVKLTFLEIIDKSHYDTVSDRLDTGGNFDYLKLFSVDNAHANFEQFRTNLDKFRKGKGYTFDEAT